MPGAGVGGARRGGRRESSCFETETSSPGTPESFTHTRNTRNVESFRSRPPIEMKSPPSPFTRVVRHYIGWQKFRLAPDPVPGPRPVPASGLALTYLLAGKFCAYDWRFVNARWRCSNLFVVPIFSCIPPPPFPQNFFYFCAKFCESFSSGFLIPQVGKEFSQHC